jgi:uncharacterized membrane protein
MNSFRKVAYILICCLALIGLAEATYLTVLAITGETAVCGGSFDCSQVLESPYARIGGFPVAAFGMLAYFAVFAFAVLVAFDYQRLRVFLSLTVYAMFAFSAWLLFVQAFRLHAFCRYCVFSASLVTFLAGLTVATSGRLEVEGAEPRQSARGQE